MYYRGALYYMCCQAPMYYRGASAAILVFDISKKDSFAVMKDWVLQ